MRALIRQLRPALLMVAVFTALTGVAYPLVVTAVSQVVFNHEANGSLIEREGPDGENIVIGSELLGQNFTAPEYLHPRPSATYEWEYNGAASSGSNLGPRSPDLLAAVEAEATAYREENGLAPDALVPVDAVTCIGLRARPAHLRRQRPDPGVPRRRGPRSRHRGRERRHRQPHGGTGIRHPRRAGRQRPARQPRARRDRGRSVSAAHTHFDARD